MTKKILITGKNSYIGRSFIEYCKKNEIDFEIDELDVRGEEWKTFDFSPYDSVFHVAGIAHNSSDPKLEDLYYDVNRDLTIAVAEKAKIEGVKQFVFMSSIIVYGTKNKIIDANTKPEPDNFYGDSKLQAEIKLSQLSSENFNIVLIRPPMIYGKGSKGNYQLLSKFAQKFPVFPDYPNKRSMLYIENLCKFVTLIVVNEEEGVFHPQNESLVQTSELIKYIAEIHNHNICFFRFMNPLINLFFKVNIIKKVFGDLYYDKSISTYKNGNYQIWSLEESINATEEK